jgi:hypothetical protein
MSQRIDRSWTVYSSVENANHDRCVDFFYRPNQTHDFEEFRRDPEDAGGWTPIAYYSGASYPSREAAMAAARATIRWLAEACS